MVRPYVSAPLTLLTDRSLTYAWAAGHSQALLSVLRYDQEVFLDREGHGSAQDVFGEFELLRQLDQPRA